jgi:hypothetical protein
VETRTIRTSTALNDYLDWPFLGQVFRIDRHVTDLDGTHPRDEVVFGLTNLTPAQADPARLSAYVRQHWGIEPRLHDVRDMTYDEDRSQVRTANGPRVMATLRNTAISLLRRLGLPNIQRAVDHLGRRPDQVARLLLG